MKLLNHVQIKVKDLESSQIFYDAIMRSLGYRRVLEIPGVVIGYGTTVHDMFEIRQADHDSILSHAVHIAFNAVDKQSVDRFYQIALEQGATSHGQPGLRTAYEAGYYAAFVIDPDGHNIEAVCMI